jgi:hypothetical protein
MSQIERLFQIGMQFSKTEGSKFAVFGFDHLDQDRAVRVKKYIAKNAKLISRYLDALEIFKVNVAGYCPTCPAYVQNWPRQYNKKIYDEWCIHSAYFLGKAGSLIRLERYDPGHKVFKRIYKRKRVPCPLTEESCNE